LPWRRITLRSFSSCHGTGRWTWCDRRSRALRSDEDDAALSWGPPLHRSHRLLGAGGSRTCRGGVALFVAMTTAMGTKECAQRRERCGQVVEAAWALYTRARVLVGHERMPRSNEGHSPRRARVPSCWRTGGVDAMVTGVGLEGAARRAHGTVRRSEGGRPRLRGWGSSGPRVIGHRRRVPPDTPRTIIVLGERGRSPSEHSSPSGRRAGVVGRRQAVVAPEGACPRQRRWVGSDRRASAVGQKGEGVRRSMVAFRPTTGAHEAEDGDRASVACIHANA
jgi:hypothetical protein